MSNYVVDSQKHKLFGNRIIDAHGIGDYQFIECVDADGHTQFHIYVSEISIGRSIDNLDAAIVYAIAHKYDGPNLRAGEYFVRMVGMGEQNKS